MRLKPCTIGKAVSGVRKSLKAQPQPQTDANHDRVLVRSRKHVSWSAGLLMTRWCAAEACFCMQATGCLRTSQPRWVSAEADSVLLGNAGGQS